MFDISFTVLLDFLALLTTNNIINFIKSIMSKLITFLGALTCALVTKAEVCFSTNKFPKWADTPSTTLAVAYSE